MISQLIWETFSPSVQHVLPEVTLPPEVTPERVTTYIVDSSARPENRPRLEYEVRRANVICIIYAIDNSATSRRVSEFWIPFIRSTGVNVSLTYWTIHTKENMMAEIDAQVPLVLVGNKVDLRDESTPLPTMEQTIVPIMEQHREIETCLECSALAADNVSEVFYLAQKAVLHPTAPIYDSNIHQLKEPCVSALLRIFKLCDADRDGLLSNSELNEFQRKCFNVPLQQQEMDGVKSVVMKGDPDGIVDECLTESGTFAHVCMFPARY